MKKLQLLILLVLCVIISFAQSPTISANVSDYNGYGVSTSGANDGSIELTVTGGTPPYTYSWSIGNTNQNIYGLHAGTYGVTVTDDVSEMAEASYTLTEPNNGPTLNLVAADPKCYGENSGWIDAQVIGGSSPYTYLWNNGSTESTLYNIPSGYYAITITDNIGTTVSSDATLVDPDELETNGSPYIYPNGEFFSCETCNDGIVTIIPSGGMSPYTYLWDDGDTDDTRENVQQDVYIAVTITDFNSCTITDGGTLGWGMGPGNGGSNPLVVTENISLYPNGYNTSAPAMNDASIELTVSGGNPPYSFAWDHGPTTQNVYNLAGGSYGVNVSDTNGSYTYRAYYINADPGGGGEPLSVTEMTSMWPNGYNITGPGLSDGSIELNVWGGAAPYSFLWNDGSTDQNRYDLSEGTYGVTVTDAASDNVVRSIYLSAPLSGGPLVVTGQASNYGNGYNTSGPGIYDGYITLNLAGGMPPYNFSWSNGSSDQNIFNLGDGMYDVHVSDMNGNDVYETYYIYSPPGGSGSLYANINQNYNSCDGTGSLDVYVSDGMSPYSYAWSGPNGPMSETSSMIGISQGGIYSVTVTDMNNNTVEASTEVFDNGQMSMTLNAPLIDGVYNTTCAGGDGVIEVSISGGMPPYNIDVYGDEGYHQSLSTGNSYEQIIGLEESDMFVEIRDMGGCYVGEDIELTGPPALKIDVTPNVYPDGNYFSCPTCNDGQLTGSANGGSGNYTYQWFVVPPGSRLSVEIQGASLYFNDPEMLDAGDDVQPTPLNSGPTITNVAPETWYGIMVVDDQGCEGAKVFNLERPKESAVGPTGATGPQGATGADGAQNAWALGGNSGSGNWLGTNDVTDLELRANNQTQLRIGANGVSTIEQLRLNNLNGTEEGLLFADINGNVNRIDGIGFENPYDVNIPFDPQSGPQIPAGTTSQDLEPRYNPLLRGGGGGDCSEFDPWSKWVRLPFNASGGTDIVKCENGGVGIGELYFDLPLPPYTPYRMPPLARLHLHAAESGFQPAMDNIVLSRESINSNYTFRLFANEDDLNVLALIPRATNLNMPSDFVPGTEFVFQSDGNLGIGLDNPHAKLTVKPNALGALDIQDVNGNSTLYADGYGKLIVGKGYFNGPDDEARLYLGDGHHYLRSTHSKGLSFNTFGVENAMIIQQSSGKVGIGVDFDHNFGEGLLEVNGTIRSKKVVVETSGWPDYVFNEDYKVMSLQDLNKYIANNKHLPGVPDAETIDQEGLDLGNLVKLQMEKIEELTLYIIDLEKRLSEVEKQ